MPRIKSIECDCDDQSVRIALRELVSEGSKRYAVNGTLPLRLSTIKTIADSVGYFVRIVMTYHRAPRESRLFRPSSVTLSEMLRKVLRDGKITTRDLAGRAKVSHSSVAMYATGHRKISIDKFVALLDLAGYDVELVVSKRDEQAG